MTQDNNEAASALSAADAVHILRLALVQAECAIKGREHTGFINKALTATKHIKPAASASQSSTAGAANTCTKDGGECGIGGYCKECHLAHVARQRQESESTGCKRCYFLGFTCRECKDRGTTPSAAVAEGVDTAEFCDLVDAASKAAALPDHGDRAREAYEAIVEHVAGLCAQQREAGRRELQVELDVEREHVRQCVANIAKLQAALAR